MSGVTEQQQTTMTSLHWLDWLVIAFYFLALFTTSILVSLQSRMKRTATTEGITPHQTNTNTTCAAVELAEQTQMETDGNNDNVDLILPSNHHHHHYPLEALDSAREQEQTHAKSYFLADRSITWLAVGASLFASNIGSEHFVGISGAAFSEGMCVSWGEWLSPWLILMLAWLFAPFYLRSGIYTLPEFLERRYNRICKLYMSILSLLMYISSKISVSLFAGAMIFKVLLNWDTYISAVVLIVVTALYTISGGLTVVIYTEVLQSFLLIFGGVLVLIFGLVRVGGWTGLRDKLSTEESLFHLIQPPGHPNFPITGVLFGMPWTSLWYWCTDQVIVQRVLSAKNIHHARGGSIFAGFLKIIPPFIMVIPGMVSRALYGSSIDPNTAYVMLVKNEIPIVVRGIIVSAILAALMSSLASIFHSASTLVTMDIYREIKRHVRVLQNDPNARYSSTIAQNRSWLRRHIMNKEYVLVGRVSGIIITIVSIIWIPTIPMLSSQLYVYTHKIMAYFAPNIAAVFLGGVLTSKYANAVGAMFTLFVGFIIGIMRFIAEIALSEPASKNAILNILVNSNFLHFAAVFGALSILALFVLSTLTSWLCPGFVERMSTNKTDIALSMEEIWKNSCMDKPKESSENVTMDNIERQEQQDSENDDQYLSDERGETSDSLMPNSAAMDESHQKSTRASHKKGDIIRTSFNILASVLLCMALVALYTVFA